MPVRCRWSTFAWSLPAPIEFETEETEPAALKDLTVGLFARVTFTQDRQAVVEVRAGKGVSEPQALKRMAVLVEMDAKHRLARFFTSSPFGDISRMREQRGSDAGARPMMKVSDGSLGYGPRCRSAGAQRSAAEGGVPQPLRSRPSRPAPRKERTA